MVVVRHTHHTFLRALVQATAVFQLVRLGRDVWQNDRGKEEGKEGRQLRLMVVVQQMSLK